MDRKNWIDGLKGLGIVLMVIGHANPPEIIGKIIYGFHMPLFFAIAGYLYEENKWNVYGFNKLVKKRYESYIIPYFVWGGCNLLLNFGVEAFLHDNGFKGAIKLLIEHTIWLIYSYGLIDKMPNCTPLWFLPCIFLCTLAFYFVVRIKNKFIKAGIYISCILVEILLMKLNIIQLPWHMEVAMLGVVFMQVGFCIKKIKLKKIQGILLVMMIILATELIYLNGKVDMNTNYIGNPILFFGGSILAIIILVRVASCKIIDNAFLRYLGKNTIVIMALNYFFNTISTEIWERTLFLAGCQYFWWEKTIVVIVLCCITIEVKSFIVKRMRSNEG